MLPHLPKHSACTVSLDSICSQFSNHHYEMKSSCWPVSLHIWSPEPCCVCDYHGLDLSLAQQQWNGSTLRPGKYFLFLDFSFFLRELRPLYLSQNGAAPDAQRWEPPVCHLYSKTCVKGHRRFWPACFLFLDSVPPENSLSGYGFAGTPLSLWGKAFSPAHLQIKALSWKNFK